MQTRLIQQAWMLLAKGLGLEPPSRQYTDMRNSFFAGAYTIMRVMKDIGADDDSDNVESHIDLIESLHQECREFKAEVTYNPEQN
jgi:hypothetical protein